MASPEELEQKLRSLSLREEALKERQRQQLELETRFEEHQQKVADKERANRLKAQDLMDRERKIEEEIALLHQERKSLIGAQQRIEQGQARRTSLIMPLMLLTCVAAGYFAFSSLNERAEYYDQVATASENIDKLAKVLSFTQDKVLYASDELNSKSEELGKTRQMLNELKQTTDQLQTEIVALKGETPPTAAERSALTSSANSLFSQVSVLKAQLEDKILNDEVNEAYIDHQNSDLQRYKEQVRQQRQTLVKKQTELEGLSERYAGLESKMTALQQQYQQSQQRFTLLQQEMISLKSKIERPIP